MTPRRTLFVASLVLGTSGAALGGRQMYLAAKAQLAAVLIERAFVAHLADGRLHRPWSWADHHPIARLRVPSLELTRIVLDNASGRTLAFGLGHVDGSAPLGGAGNAVIAGHRDSWAQFLRDLQPGDEVCLITRGGERRYRVASSRVTESDDATVLSEEDGERLTLVTCWPIDGLLRGRKRYVVTCRPS